MDPRHKNCERKRQKRFISTEWCQIDLFLLSSSMNMPYISIKINYPLPCIQGNPSLAGEHASSQGAGTTSSSFCRVPAAQRSIFHSFSVSASCKNKHTRTHSFTQSSPQQVLYSPCSQRGNYHGRKKCSLTNYHFSFTLSTKSVWLLPFHVHCYYR